MSSFEVRRDAMNKPCSEGRHKERDAPLHIDEREDMLEVR
jgi:hypothetical protein